MSRDEPNEDRAAATFRQLCRLLGTWKGAGRGDFPTIDAFRYEETSAFHTRGGEVSIALEQQTWVIHDDGTREPSHWEVAILQVKEDGRIDLLNAQNSGRVEVLTGELAESADGWTLELESVVHGHDPRMVSTRRRFRLAGDRLSYEVEMATTAVPQRQWHLAAELERTNG